MTRARNIAGFSTITTTPSPVHVGPIGVLTATRIDGEFGDRLDISSRNITVAGIAATNLQVSGITTGLNVSGIITAQNGINFNGTSTGLNVSGVGTIATLSVTGNATVGGVLTYEDVTRVDSVGIVTAGKGFRATTGGLVVTAGVSTFAADISIADKIIHTGDTDTAIRFPSANTITAETGGTERLRVSGSDGVGINTDFSGSQTWRNGQRLAIFGGGGNVTGELHLGANRGDGVQAVGSINFFDNTQDTDHKHVAIIEVDKAGSTANKRGGDLLFYTKNDNVAAPTEKARIDSSGLMGLGVTPTSHNSTTAFQIYDDYNSQGYPRIRLTNQSTGTTTADGYELSLDGSNLHAVHRQRENADIYFMTNNVERLRITSGGDMGLGTNSPDRKIHCHNSSTTTNVRAKFSNGTTGEGASDGFEIGINGSNPAEAVLVNYEASPIAFFTSGSERLRIDAYGRVLIGGTSAIIGSSSEFNEIVLTGKTRGAGITLQDVDANTRFQIRTDDAGGDPQTLLNASTNHPIVIRTNNTERMRISNTGNVTISPSGDPVLTVTGSGHAQLQLTSTSGTDHCGVNFGDNDDNNAGMIQYTNSNNKMQFHTNGSERMVIDSDGYVTKSNIPCYSYRQLANTNTGSRMTSDGDLLFSTAIIASSDYNTSNGRFTAPVAGKYYFMVNMLLDDNASDGTRVVRAKVNGSIIQTIIYNYFINTSTARYYHASGGTILNLAKDDYVHFFASEGFHVGSETNVSGFLIG